MCLRCVSDHNIDSLTCYSALSALIEGVDPRNTNRNRNRNRNREVCLVKNLL